MVDITKLHDKNYMHYLGNPTYKIGSEHLYKCSEIYRWMEKNIKSNEWHKAIEGAYCYNIKNVKDAVLLKMTFPNYVMNYHDYLMDRKNRATK